MTEIELAQEEQEKFDSEQKFWEEREMETYHLWGR